MAQKHCGPAAGDDVTLLLAVIDRRQLGGRGQSGVVRGQGVTGMSDPEEGTVPSVVDCPHLQNKDRNVPGES